MPQVVDGRMIIEGVDLMRAIDIYTGRLLWETKLPGVGYFYNNLAHQPGANASGSNFVSTPDGIYVAYNNTCVRLDPATGKKVGEFALPKFKGLKESPRWGYVNVVGDYLIGGADPLLNPKSLPPKPKPGENFEDKDPVDEEDRRGINDHQADQDAQGLHRQHVREPAPGRHGSQDRRGAMDRVGEAFVPPQRDVRRRRPALPIDRLSGEQLARIKKGGPIRRRRASSRSTSKPARKSGATMPTSSAPGSATPKSTTSSSRPAGSRAIRCSMNPRACALTTPRRAA